MPAWFELETDMLPRPAVDCRVRALRQRPEAERLVGRLAGSDVPVAAAPVVSIQRPADAHRRRGVTDLTELLHAKEGVGGEALVCAPGGGGVRHDGILADQLQVSAAEQVDALVEDAREAAVFLLVAKPWVPHAELDLGVARHGAFAPKAVHHAVVTVRRKAERGVVRYGHMPPARLDAVVAKAADLAFLDVYSRRVVVHVAGRVQLQHAIALLDDHAFLVRVAAGMRRYLAHELERVVLARHVHDYAAVLRVRVDDEPLPVDDGQRGGVGRVKVDGAPRPHKHLVGSRRRRRVPLVVLALRPVVDAVLYVEVRRRCAANRHRGRKRQGRQQSQVHFSSLLLLQFETSLVQPLTAFSARTATSSAPRS